MKKALFIVLMLAVAVGLFALISTSLHNFNGDAWNTGGEICEPCHTPHNGDITVIEAPLWNHDPTVQAFDQYVGYDMDADGGTVGEPAGISLLCLSCHDGVTALDAFGGSAGDPVNNTMADHATLAGSVFGTDLRNDHPISITYDTALTGVDTELHDPSGADSFGAGLGTIQNVMLGGGDQLECSSCHDVHNTVVNLSLLRKANTASALCLTCHNK